MPRRTKSPLYPIALSANALAQCLDIHSRKVYAAIKDGALPVYENGKSRRILVSDVVDWVRTWKRSPR